MVCEINAMNPVFMAEMLKGFYGKLRIFNAWNLAL